MKNPKLTLALMVLALLGSMVVNSMQNRTILQQRVELQKQLRTMLDAQSKQVACYQELQRVKEREK